MGYHDRSDDEELDADSRRKRSRPTLEPKIPLKETKSTGKSRTRRRRTVRTISSDYGYFSTESLKDEPWPFDIGFVKAEESSSTGNGDVDESILCVKDLAERDKGAQVGDDYVRESNGVAKRLVEGIKAVHTRYSLNYDDNIEMTDLTEEDKAVKAEKGLRYVNKMRWKCGKAESFVVKNLPEGADSVDREVGRVHNSNVEMTDLTEGAKDNRKRDVNANEIGFEVADFGKAADRQQALRTERGRRPITNHVCYCTGPICMQMSTNPPNTDECSPDYKCKCV